MGKRIATFDIARAFAMAAVIVGHTVAFGSVSSLFCFSFDLPVFFIVSGYFLRPDTKLDRVFFTKSARALLLPYVVTCAIVIALRVLRAAILPTESVLGAFVFWTRASLYGAGAPTASIPIDVGFIGAVWYLLALFFARTFLVMARQTRLCPLIVVALFALGYLTTPYIWLPWSIQAGMCATVFLYVGQLIRSAGIFEGKGLADVPLLAGKTGLARVLEVAIWIALGVLWMLTVAYGGQLAMVENIYPAGALNFFGGIAGALCVLKLSELVGKRLPAVSSPLAAFGSITLPVFCMHLVEMDCLPWNHIGGFVAGLLPIAVPFDIIVLVGRSIAIAVMVWILWKLPRPISGVYFASRRAQKGTSPR